jgi:hypothetical protein
MRAIFALLAILALIGSNTVRAVGAVTETKPRGTDSAPGSDASGNEKTLAIPMAFSRKVVFTLAIGTDASTSAKITVALASELRRNAKRMVPKGTVAPADAWQLNSDSLAVVPAGGWTLKDYSDQCAQFPDSTQGAFIVLPAAMGSDSENYLVVLRQNTTISFNAMVAGCESDGAPKPTGTAKILWVSDTASGKYGRSTVQFLPLAVLTSVYLAFAPQKTFQTTTTTAFPTPNPLPVSGARTSTQSLSSNVINASGTGSLQNAVVSSFAGAQLAVGRQGNADHLAMHAAEDAVGKFLQLVNEECRQTAKRQSGATPDPSPADVPAMSPFCKW